MTNNERQFTINDIEALTEEQAQAMATERHDIKGHQVYFVDFGGYFGFSAIVFKRNRHIKYANDYELHHPHRNREQLKEWYFESLGRKLFTEEELTEGAKTYDEYQRKAYYLQNYFVYSLGFVSAFYIRKPDEEQENASKTMFYCPTAYGYLPTREDVKRVQSINQNLKESYKKAIWENPDNFREMMRYECGNYEVGYSGDWEQMLYSMGMSIDNFQEWQKKIFFEEVRRAERKAINY